MKKIIAVVLIGFSIMTCFAACGNNSTTTSASTIERATALSYQRQQPEDCWFSEDGKTFYRVFLRDENDKAVGVESWSVKLK